MPKAMYPLMQEGFRKMLKQPRGLLLYGGGLDSTALLLELLGQGVNVVALHVNYGQVAYQKERVACQFFCGRYGAAYDTLIADLAHCAPGASIVGGKGGDMMDGRNAVLIAIAAMYASSRGIFDIYLGFHQEPPDHPFPDATTRGLEAMQVAVDKMYKSHLLLHAPFSHMTRFEIVKRGVELAGPRFLNETHTCYTNEHGGCGKCAHCVQKAGYEAQLKAG